MSMPGPADYTPRWVANPGASWPHGKTTRVLGRTNRRFQPTQAEIEASLVPSPAAYQVPLFRTQLQLACRRCKPRGRPVRPPAHADPLQKLAEAGTTRAAMRHNSKHKGFPSAFFGTADHSQEFLFLSKDGMTLLY